MGLPRRLHQCQKLRGNRRGNSKATQAQASGCRASSAQPSGSAHGANATGASGEPPEAYGILRVILAQLSKAMPSKGLMPTKGLSRAAISKLLEERRKSFPARAEANTRSVSLQRELRQRKTQVKQHCTQRGASARTDQMSRGTGTRHAPSIWRLRSSESGEPQRQT